MKEIKVTVELTPAQIETIGDALIWRKVEADRWIDGDLAGSPTIVKNEQKVKDSANEILGILKTSLYK